MPKLRLVSRALIYSPMEQGVLMGQRSSTDKNSPSQWALLGGKVDPGETPLLSVIREVREEAGVLFVPENEDEYVVLDNKTWRTHFFVGKVIGDVVLDPVEHQASRYVLEDDLDALHLAFDHETIIRQFLRSLR